MKRLFDIIVSFCGLVLLSPLMLCTAIAIFATSGMPILFRQQRVGIHSRDFTIYKFRSMTVSKQAEKGSFDAGSNVRITPVGKFLRKYKLDELPQLFNVIKGDMSVIGPRPEIRKWVDAYPEQWSYVHSIRPGISDPAVANKYRDEESILAKSDDPEATYRDVILPEKLSLYKHYVDNMSFVYDIRLVLTTLRSVYGKKRI